MTAKEVKLQQPPLNDGETQELKLSRKPRLAVFGGTFDPVHNGHLLIAGDLLRRELVDEVLFVPARVAPHKLAAAVSAPEHRLAMLALALAAVPAFSISDIEIRRREQSSYTIDTLDLLKAAYPGHELFFVMGMDSLNELHLWHRSAELISRYRFMIFPRPAVEPPPYAALAGHFGARNARKLFDAVLEMHGVDISATVIRQTQARGQTLAGLVPAAVRDYILEHELYQNVEDSERTECRNPHHLPNP